MNIQIVSDIHVEFWNTREKFNFIKPTAQMLALVGDICCCASDEDFESFKRFILEILPLYNEIFMVTGNHEYYFNPSRKVNRPTQSCTIKAVDEKIKAFFKATSKKLHFLNNNSCKIIINNITYIFAGSTLWTWIPEDQRKAIKDSMNDYSFIYTSGVNPNGETIIRNITPDDVVDMHLKCYKFLKSQVNRAKKLKAKLIFFTHHKPYISDHYDCKSMDVAYESDLSKLFGYVSLWGYGHTHVADNRIINKTMFYSNPKGYPKQRTFFKRAESLKI